jgi:hypothetical protein
VRQQHRKRLFSPAAETKPHTSYYRERRARLIANGTCVQCASRRACAGVTLCRKCRDKHNRENKQSRADGVRSETRKLLSAQRKTRRAARVDQERVYLTLKEKKNMRQILKCISPGYAQETRR